MSESHYKYRQFNVSLNFGLVFYFFNSKTYKFRNGISPIIVGFLYCVINLFTGFWDFFGIFRRFQGLRNTLTAMYTNISGGYDVTKSNIESDYDEYTVYIYNNLERKVFDKVSLEDIEIIIDIQNQYLIEGRSKYSEENLIFILENLKKIDIDRLDSEDIQMVFNSMKIYDTYGIHDN